MVAQQPHVELLIWPVSSGFSHKRLTIKLQKRYYSWVNILKDWMIKTPSPCLQAHSLEELDRLQQPRGGYRVSRSLLLDLTTGNLNTAATGSIGERHCYIRADLLHVRYGTLLSSIDRVTGHYC